MASPYKTGTRTEVIRFMAQCAIRDQMALIDAYEKTTGGPDADGLKQIAESKAAIRDFLHAAKTMTGESK